MKVLKQCSSSIFAMLALTACASFTPSIYKLDMRQGNIIEAEQVAQLETGMSKQQVQTLLGTPLITDPFNQQRWDYIYAFYPRGNQAAGEQQRLTLFFEGESLSRIDNAELNL